MAKEFIRTLSLAILLNCCYVCFSQNNNESIKLHLSVEQDTLYAEETLTLSFSLSTDRWLPNRIILNPESFEVVNTKESVLPNGIHVSIKHNGEKYEELCNSVL